MSTLIVPAHVPSVTEDVEQLRKAFGGWGTNEDLIISILAHRNAAQRKSIRQTYAETYNEDLLKALDKELSNDFERLVLLWTLEPAERDAVLANEATKRWTSSNQVLVEIACARSPHELLLAKQAYHARFKKSLEEDVAHHTTGDFRKLLVPLVSTYRYNGDEVNMTLAKSEAKILHENISKKDYSNEDLIRILATRSKAQVNATLNQYKNEFGHDIIEDIKEAFTIELSRPHGSTSKLELYCADVIRSVMDPSENVKTSSGHLGLDGSLATDQGSSNTICTLHSIGGLSWSLPEGRRIEDCLLCWVGADNAAFANVVLTFNGCEIVRYDAAENRLVTDVSHQRRILKRRYYLVEKAKDANIIGILVGTLGVAGYLHMINQMKGLITRAGKNVDTLVMGKPNPAKLANFPEVRNFLERCKIWSKNSRT